MARLIDGPDVFGQTVFCDDIRMEATGKLIYIGVYQSVMLIHVPFPFVLPIAFAISLAQRADIFDPKITLRIFLPGDPDDASSDEASIVTEMNEANPGAVIAKTDATADELGISGERRKYVTWSANIQFQALEIKEPGLIKVRADIGDTRYRLGTLMVMPAPTQKA